MIDEQQLLVNDLLGSRALVAVGWGRRRLVREDHVGKVSVCPLGAIGLTTEGRKFRSWALVHALRGHVEWKWSPRAQAVMDALRPHVVKFTNDPVFTDTVPVVNLIANTNDVCVMHRRTVLGWFDAAIADARNELGKEEPCRRGRVQVGQHVMKRLDRQLAGVATERHHDGLAGDIFVTRRQPAPRRRPTASRNVASAAANCRCALGCVVDNRRSSRISTYRRQHRRARALATRQSLNMRPASERQGRSRMSCRMSLAAARSGTRQLSDPSLSE
jgi:hypothetical protein